jgi:hypothetical protein
VSHEPWTAIPAWHGNLLPRRGVDQDVEPLLRTGRFPTHGTSTTAFRAIRGAAAAWQVPALPLRARPQWNAPPDTDPAFAGWHCPAPVSHS